ncbi:MAG: BatA domain-containing protein [Thermoguttaceae bacterium]
MTFLNFALLSGAGLIVIPIVLHLIMRQRPKLLEFPALRFIQKRHDTNQRRLRLRHLLLLLLRAGAIALLALALARPSIKFSSRLGSQEAPVAAALIFDAAPHMQYRHDKKTRLEAAQEIGQWLLAQLPPESQVAVFDSGMAPRDFDADRGLSKQRIEKLEIAPNPRSLSQIVADAALLLKDKSNLPAKEIYVFTDLSRASWRPDETAKLQDRLHEVAGVSLYLIDVGVNEPSNFALGDLHLSQQVVAAGGSVEIQTDVSSLGIEGERVIELDLSAPDGKGGRMQKISEQIKRLTPGDSQTVDFRLPSLKPGTQQGLVRIVGQDSLTDDDVRYFSVEVRPPWPVLVVAQQPIAESAIYLTEAVAPAEMRKRHDARFDCKVISYNELADQTLEKFAAVCLLDPPGLEPGAWQGLTNYAAAGHGVGIFLGRRALPIEAFNSPAAQQLLPGKVREQVPREEGNTYLAPQNFQHSVLKSFAPYSTRTPWNRFPVYRYWRIDDLAPDASTVIAFNDGRAALLERTIRAGQAAGHVLLMSTPFSDRVSRRDAWNVLPGSAEVGAWPFLILANQIMSYLVGSGEQQLNYFAGTNSVTLSVDGPVPRRYVLARPDGVNTPLPLPEKAELSISGVEQVGNYQVHCVGEPIEPDRGFSVNLPAQVTQLARLTDQELSDTFGPFKPQVSRSNDQIVRNVNDSRVGREIYPWLILVFAGLLAVEYVVSNWFYKIE